MSINKYEKFNLRTIKRSEIHGAEYNPRKISEAARKKLGQIIKKHGLVMPAVVWNKRTENVVGGHQRLERLDSFFQGEDYELTISEIDVSQDEEIKINILLNNPSAQGEWDNDLLANIKESFPEINFIDDLKFEKFDLDYIFASVDKFDNVSDLFKETESQKIAIADIEKIKQAKKDHREKVKELNQDGVTHNVENDDYYVTLVFNNNSEKHEFMKSIKKPEKDKFIKSSILYDIYNQIYKIC